MAFDAVIEVNGVQAGLPALTAVMQNPYGHFTALQVRSGGVVGLQAHFDRLQEATRCLFASELDLAQVNAWLRQALQRAGVQAMAASSVRITVFSARFDRNRPGDRQAADVMIGVGPPWPARNTPLRVCSQVYQRDLAPVKHLGTFGLFRQRALAQQAGFDDALFVDGSGRVSEGSFWNAGFWDGRRVIWPNAAMLDGVTQQVLKKALSARGVEQVTREVVLADLSGMVSAFACNSTGYGTPIVAIDDQRFAPAAEFIGLLDQTYAGIPAEPIR